MTENLSPCLIFPQSNSDAANSVAGLHVSVLNGLSELILQAQHLRDQFQQSVHISAHRHTNACVRRWGWGWELDSTQRSSGEKNLHAQHLKIISIRAINRDGGLKR